MAFVCFTVASRPKYIAATVLEFVVTLLLVLLYVLKLNKRLTFFFWPLVVGDSQHGTAISSLFSRLCCSCSVLSSSLQDAFNSVFAAVYFIVLSLMALATHTVTGTLVGGVSFALLSFPVTQINHPNNASICAHVL